MTGLDVVGEEGTALPPPHFMKNKKPEAFTDEEVAAAESHLAEISRYTKVIMRICKHRGNHCFSLYRP